MEAAVVFPLLTGVFFGLWNLGRGLQTYYVLTRVSYEAVRAAGRISPVAEGDGRPTPKFGAVVRRLLEGNLGKVPEDADVRVSVRDLTGSGEHRTRSVTVTVGVPVPVVGGEVVRSFGIPTAYHVRAYSTGPLLAY